MTVRKPLVQIAGVINELPSADTINLGASAMADNVISTNLTIPADKSYIVAGDIQIDADLTIDGNLGIVG